MNTIRLFAAFLAGVFVIACNLLIFLSALWMYFAWSLDHGNIH
jgi:hypothetical protein